MDGFFVVDKPEGLTSHDVVAYVRRVLNQKKVGHTGTLDPFATGVLPIAVGQATKAIPYLDESVKRYRAVMMLGTATDTLDKTGKTVRTSEFDRVTRDEMLEAFSRFQGTIFQTPPMFSAIKQGGIPLYKLARRGEEVERVSRKITIFDITLDSFDLPLVTFTVTCSRGTYVRVLAGDIGGAVGACAHLTELRRLDSGPFSANKAISLDALKTLQSEGRVGEWAISTYHALSHLRVVELTEKGAKKVSNGVSPGEEGDFAFSQIVNLLPDEMVRLSFDDKLLGIATGSRPNGTEQTKNIRLLRVFT